MEGAGDRPTDFCTTDQQLSQETCADDMDTALTATELQSDNPSVSQYIDTESVDVTAVDVLADQADTVSAYPVYDMTVDKLPYQLANSVSDYYQHFLKGCKWCRDGSSLLVGCDDKRMRVCKLPEQFYTGDFSNPIPEMTPSVVVKEGGTIYDFCWYPLMDCYNETTCCFLTTSQNSPIHLWDSNSGKLTSTYRLVNHLDELDSAHSVSFTPDGTLIYAGFIKQIHVFDVTRPGAQIESIKTHKKRQTGQTGIISCFDFLPQNRTFAAGSYSRSIGVYDERNNKQTMILEGHSGGVTQIKFHPDGNLLLSGARKDNELLVWDMRNPGQILAILQRNVSTNQRIMFDIDPSGRYVCSGGTDGLVSIWDLYSIDYITEQTEQEITPILKYPASESDCVNTACFHPTLAMVTTSSGQRSYKSSIIDTDSDSDHSDIEQPKSRADNSVRLWWIGP